LYVSTRTQAIFQAIFDSFSNYQRKISARMFQREPKLCFKLNMLLITQSKAKSQSTDFIQ